MLEGDYGWVCASCDAYCALDALSCVLCGAMLPKGRESMEAQVLQGAADSIYTGLTREPAYVGPESTLGPPKRSEKSLDAKSSADKVLENAAIKGAERLRPITERLKEEAMEQVRSYVCAQCATPVPAGHKFCGRCGAPIPEDVAERKIEFFGSLQTVGRARISLIRGEGGAEGMSFLLQGTDHIAGRNEGTILFPSDTWLNGRHANFFYKGEKLYVRDESSVNGVYLRIKASATLKPGDQFLCGEQVFRLEATPKDDSGPDPDGTHFYASPKRPSPFRVVQLLRGGAAGMVYCARENTVQIGRDECDMNFPDDVFMSALHSRIEVNAQGNFMVTDCGSKNGTYLLVREATELAHGDYLFLGKQLLRVEMTA